MNNQIDPAVAGAIRLLQSSDPLVSIVIPAYNEEKYLLKTLRSVSRISTIHPVEIIGINNASTDRTREIFLSHAVRVIDEPMKGLPHARATGIRNAKGEIILQLDADAQVPETWVDEHVSRHKENDVIAVSGMSFIVGVHPLVRAWCIGSKVFRSMLGERREVLYGVGPNISYRTSAGVTVLDAYESYQLRPEDLHMLELLGAAGRVVSARGAGIDTRLNGRKHATLKSALKLIGGSIFRKISWRYKKYFPPEDAVALEDIR